MITKTNRKFYENGEGVEVLFYSKGIKVGEACTVIFDGKPNSFLHGLEVDKRHRNNGYGSSIITYMVDKYDVDTLYVENDNMIAISLYEKFGFKAIQNFDEKYIIMRRTT